MSEVVVALDGGVLTVTMARPDKKNAITNAMYGAMADALERAESDSAIRAVLLQGDGDSFTAGNDLADFAAVSRGVQGERHVGRFLAGLARATRPLVAAVQGNAVGIGTTMLLHCDLVYVSETAKLSLPFVQLGLCPEAASSMLLPRLLGHQRAAEKLMLGEPFSAQEALQIGLATRVLPVAELNEFVHQQARKLAALPASSLRETKRLMKGGDKAAVQARMAEEGEVFRCMLQAPEAKEAFKAFFEKRRPDFSQFS